MTPSIFDYEAELGACAAGDRSAFLALYRHEAPAMYALAQAMLGDGAEDVLHEAFVLIWRNAAGYSPSLGTARAWMYSILRYRALSRLREARSAGGLAAEHAALPTLNAPAGACALSHALTDLPPAQRDALLQAYLHGGDCAHIADRLDRSEPDIQASIESALTRIDQAVQA